MSKPLKRHIALQPVSREHHHGLLLAWKIREGIKKKTDLVRIKKYTNWFWVTHLKPHFEFEEKYLFPVLAKGHNLTALALSQHRALESQFTSETFNEASLLELEHHLVEHIRFEERVLFQKIQEMASIENLEAIQKSHQMSSDEKWEDEFWLNY